MAFWKDPNFGQEQFDPNAYLDQLLADPSMLDGGGGAMGGDPWADLNAQYGLNEPSAPGMPAGLPGVQLDAPPMLSTDPARYQDFTDMVSGNIGDVYGYDTPQAQTSLIDGVPGADVAQFGTSPELQHMLSGQGFTPQQLALMQTQAREAPALTGQQQLGQMKRALSQAGIEGPAAAGMLGDVARNTGYAQNQNLQNVALQNAQQGNQNMQFGINQQSQIGLSNMQQANMMASQAANRMFEALRANQSAQNSMNQFNTGNQVQQKQQQAGAQAGYQASAGLNAQSNALGNEQENANKQWGQELQNTNYDWQKQLLPWQELNQRYGQAAGTLGSWGA